MREILFRGRRIDNGEWVFGYSIFCASRVFIVDRDDKTSLRGFTTNRCDKYDWRSVEVNPATVGQLTGLTDKNGKKIFEGDVVSDDDGQFASVEWFKSASQFLAEFGDGYDLQELGEWCTVVGNIHDNPELLGGAE